MPVINATTPTVVPATDERTFPYWYLTDLRINGSRPEQVTLVARLRKCRYLQDGTPEFAPGCIETEFSIADFFAYMANNQTAADWFADGIALIVAEGTAQGVL